MNWLIAICQVIFSSYRQVLFFVGNVVLLTYIQSYFSSSEYLGLACVVGFRYVLCYVVVWVMCYVCIVGVIVLLFVVLFYTSGF
jgi:hypothetical protein